MDEHGDGAGLVLQRRTLLAGALAAGAMPLRAQAGMTSAWPPHEGVRLWPGDAPGTAAPLPIPRLERRPTPPPVLLLTGVATPTLYVFRPERPNGIGLLVIPGGGYELLAVENEGLDVAAAFTARGFTVFLLVHRLPAEGWRDRADVPLQDAQRAMRLIRAGAAGYGVDPDRVGVLGFSAGGHLASSLATGWNETVHAPVDATDLLSARPAFAGLIYPVTTLRLPGTHKGSRDHLLGPDAGAALVDRRSPLLHIAPGLAPCFVLHALDDAVVPPDSTVAWLAACRAAGVTVEAHFLQKGGHGFGVGLHDADPGSQWPALFSRWVSETVAA